MDNQTVPSPILSILIPTFRRPRQLINLLDSILKQLTFGIEVIVSDNSEDSETEVSLQNSGFLNAIKYSKNPQNIGPDRNFTKLIRMATGKYIWLVGDDDFVLPNTLNNIINILSSNDFEFIIINGLDQFGKMRLRGLYHELQPICKEDFFNNYTIYTTWISALVYQKKVADKVNFEAYHGSGLNHVLPLYRFISQKINPKIVLVRSPVVKDVSNPGNSWGKDSIRIFSKNLCNEILKLHELRVTTRLASVRHSNPLRSIGYLIYLRRRNLYKLHDLIECFHIHIISMGVFYMFAIALLLVPASVINGAIKFKNFNIRKWCQMVN